MLVIVSLIHLYIQYCLLQVYGNAHARVYLCTYLLVYLLVHVDITGLPGHVYCIARMALVELFHFDSLFSSFFINKQNEHLEDDVNLYT